MITVYTGPMFSGKTQALMARLQTKQRAHKNVLVVKPALDDRYESVDEIVVKQKTAQRFEKHASMAAYPIKSAEQLGAPSEVRLGVLAAVQQVNRPADEEPKKEPQPR